MDETRKRIEQRIDDRLRELNGVWNAMQGATPANSGERALKTCGAALSRLCAEYVAAGGTRARFVEICHQPTACE